MSTLEEMTEVTTAFETGIDMVVGMQTIAEVGCRNDVMLKASMEAIYPGHGTVDVSMEGIKELFIKIIEGVKALARSIAKLFKRFTRWLTGEEKKTEKAEEEVRKKYSKRGEKKTTTEKEILDISEGLKLPYPIWGVDGKHITVAGLISYNQTVMDLLEAVKSNAQTVSNTVNTLADKMAVKNESVIHVTKLADAAEANISDSLAFHFLENDKLEMGETVKVNDNGSQSLVHRAISNKGVYLYAHLYQSKTTYQWLTISPLAKMDALSRFDKIQLDESFSIDTQALNMHATLVRMAVTVADDVNEQYEASVKEAIHGLESVTQFLTSMETQAPVSRNQVVKTIARITKVLSNGISASMRMSQMVVEDTKRSLAAIAAVVDYLSIIEEI